MSGFFSPAAAKMSITSSDDTALRDDLADRVVESLGPSLPLAGAFFVRTARTAWKNATSSRIRSASSCGTASANAFDNSLTA